MELHILWLHSIITHVLVITFKLYETDHVQLKVIKFWYKNTFPLICYLYTSAVWTKKSTVTCSTIFQQVTSVHAKCRSDGIRLNKQSKRYRGKKIALHGTHVHWPFLIECNSIQSKCKKVTARDSYNIIIGTSFFSFFSSRETVQFEGATTHTNCNIFPDIMFAGLSHPHEMDRSLTHTEKNLRAATATM